MNSKELAEKIAKTRHSDWFEKLEINLSDDELGYELILKGGPAINSFVENQKQLWGNSISIIRSEFGYTVRFWQQFSDELGRVLDILSDDFQEDHLQSLWQSRIQNQFDVRLIERNDVVFIWERPETKFLFDILENEPHHFAGAYDYLVGPEDFYHKIKTRDFFTGAILAHDYRYNQSDNIDKSYSALKKSVDEFYVDLKRKTEEIENLQVQLVSELNTNLKKQANEIDGIREEKEKSISDWLSTTRAGFDKFQKASENKISDIEVDFNEFWKASENKISGLEKTYHESIRLKKPAEFWCLRAQKLRKQGYLFATGLLIVVISITILLFSLLRNPPAEMKESFTSGNASAIKWAIVFTTFISFLAVLVRIFTKSMFSAFHLARDAEEREQLTYVYLSLIHENAVDKADRNLILQSLFSRADTGLLKEESSVTMPGNMAESVLKR